MVTSSTLRDAIGGAAPEVGEYSGAGPEYTAMRLSSSAALCVDCGLDMAPRLAFDVVVIVGSVALARSSLGRRRRSGRGEDSRLRTPSASRKSRGTAAMVLNGRFGLGLGVGYRHTVCRSSLQKMQRLRDREIHDCPFIPPRAGIVHIINKPPSPTTRREHRFLKGGGPSLVDGFPLTG